MGFRLVQLLLVFSCLLQADAKVTLGNFKLDGTVPEKFIAKFSFGVGEGRLEGQFHTNGAYYDTSELNLYAIMDEKWEAYQAALTCVERAGLSARVSRLEIADEDGGGEGFFLNETFTHAIRTHYWYFVVADCTLEQYLHETPVVTFSMSFFNEPGDVHLPADEFGLPRLHQVSLLILFAFIVLYLYHMGENRKRQGETHAVIIMAFVSLMLAFFSTLFEVIHLDTFQRNGIGSPVCDTIATLLDCVSDMVTSLLLVSFSYGWTLGAAKAGSVLEFAKSNVDIVALLTVVIIFLHIVLVVGGRAYQDDFNQFHDFEHWPGRVLVLLRVILWGFFAHGTRSMLREHPIGDISLFLRRLGVFGSAWFLSFPLLVCIASLFAQYLRHRVISGGTLVVQTIALVALTRLFFAPGSAYYKLSDMGNAGIIASAPTMSEPVSSTGRSHKD